MKRRFIAACAVAACAVAAALSAVATGCTQDTAGRGQTTAAAPVRTGQEPELTQAERLRISDASEVLTKRCMNRAGFSYWTG